MLQTIRYSLLTIIAGIIVFCIFHFVTNPQHTYYKDCGIIKSKSNDEVAIKHGSRTELYLNIDFDKNGFVSKEVGPTTYFKHNVGDRICFEFINETSIWPDLFWGIGIISTFSIGCLILTIFVMFLIGFENIGM